MKTHLPKILLIFAIICAIPTATAQTTTTQSTTTTQTTTTAQTITAQTTTNDFKATRIVKGAVIDKNGNPLPGATVSATGGAETVTTDADGTYSIEVPAWLTSLTASYPGLRNKKISLDAYDTVIFKLTSKTETYAFLDIVVANTFIHTNKHTYDQFPDGYKNFQFGILGGKIYNRWGIYGKISLGIRDKYDDSMTKIPEITLGVVKKIWNRWNLLLGLGFTDNYYYSDTSYIWESLTPCAEGGIMFILNKINLLAGIQYIPELHNTYDYKLKWGAFIGVGINL